MMAGVLALGGIGARGSGNADVIRKWRTWMVSAPLVAGCLWLGTPGAVLLAAGLGVTGAVEYGRLARLRPGDSALIAATAVILPLVAWRMPAELSRVLAAALLAAALVPVIGGDAVAGARRAAAAVFGAGWLAALTGLVLLRAAALPLIMAGGVGGGGGRRCVVRRAPAGRPCAVAAVARQTLDRGGRRGAGRIGGAGGGGSGHRSRGVHARARDSGHCRPASR